MTAAVTEAIKTAAAAEALFDLSRTESETFFTEWQTGLAEISDRQKNQLNELRDRYLYQRSSGQPLKGTEGTVALLLAHPY